jgi:tetratricopeptide (TPR) repeat protein
MNWECFILIGMRSAYILYLAMAAHAAAGQTEKAVPAAGADEFLRNGIAAQQHGDMKSAIEDYRQALAREPNLAAARANLGAALSADGQFDAAIEEDTRALTTAPDKTTVRMNLALAYYKKGDTAHAHTEFEAVHAAWPREISAAVLLGYTDIKLDREADAVALLTPLEAGHESNTDLEYVLAFALIQTGKADQGLPRMEKVARLTRSADAYVIAGDTRMRRSEFRDAEADLDSALELNPSLPGLYTMDGQAHDALGDTEKSIPAFEAALRADPKDFTADLYLGITRLKQRDFDKAGPLLELALELRPNWPLARLQMAKLNGMTGKYLEAAATLEDIIKNDPKWLDPHVELATIYYKLHRPEDGQREREIVAQIEAQQQKAGPPKN